MPSLNKIFLRGFIALTPMALTIYIVYSAVVLVEGLLASTLMELMPPDLYIPGLGFLVTLVLIFLAGLLLSTFLADRLLAILEEKLLLVPFIRAIYTPLKDVMNLFSKQGPQEQQSVVLVQVNPQIQMLGIVTRTAFADLKLGGDLNDKVAVYMPLSYGLGGYTILIHRSALTPLDIPIERAMSLAITGWVKVKKESEALRAKV